MSQSKFTLAVRTSIYLDVVRLMMDGMTQEKACTKVGISVSAFTEFKRNHPDALSIFQDALLESSREMLGDLISARVRILHKLVQDAETATPGERLAIFTQLEKFLDKLATETRLNAATDPNAIADVLGGPILKPGISRFAIEESPDKSQTIITVDRTKLPPGTEPVEGAWEDLPDPAPIPPTDDPA